MHILLNILIGLGAYLLGGVIFTSYLVYKDIESPCSDYNWEYLAGRRHYVTTFVQTTLAWGIVGPLMLFALYLSWLNMKRIALKAQIIRSNKKSKLNLPEWF